MRTRSPSLKAGMVFVLCLPLLGKEQVVLCLLLYLISASSARKETCAVRWISKVAAGAFLLVLLAGLGRVAAAQGNPALFRQPDIGRTGIVFVYGGDLWLAPRAGGIARRL